MFRKWMMLFLILMVSLPAVAQMKTSRTIFRKPTTQVSPPQPPPPPPGQPTPQPEAAPAQETTDDETANAETASSPPPSQCDSKDLTGLFPTSKDSKAAECFWDQNGFQLLKNAQMVSSNGSVAAATEMMSDFFYGWRINFSSAVASQSDDDESEDGGTTTAADDPSDDGSPKEDAAVNLLQANGGNLALSAAYPLYTHAFGGDGNGSAGFVAVTYTRLAGTFDAFGNNGGSGESLDFKDMNANAEWAVTTQTKLLTMSELFDFELYTNTGLIAGTKTFRNAVGIEPKDAGAFLHAEIGANVKIGGKMLIGASWNYYSADGIDGGASLTVGFGR
jgi:hypothetical protein